MILSIANIKKNKNRKFQKSINQTLKLKIILKKLLKDIKSGKLKL